MGTSNNLKEAAAQYIQHLAETGQKPSTVGTARRTLDLLIADMGEGKEVGKILPVHTAAFFKSEAATMQPGKDGQKPRAQASVLQIRRIVRSALVWWHEQGLSKSIPVPADEKKFLQGRKGKKATPVEGTGTEATGSTKTTTEPAPEPAVEPAAEPTAPVDPVPAPDEHAGQQEEAAAAHLDEVEDDAARAQMQTDGTPDQAEQSAPAVREFVACHKTHQRRAVEICQEKGCINKAAAAKCRHWQQWAAEGKV